MTQPPVRTPEHKNGYAYGAADSAAFSPGRDRTVTRPTTWLLHGSQVRAAFLTRFRVAAPGTAADPARPRSRGRLSAGNGATGRLARGSGLVRRCWFPAGGRPLPGAAAGAAHGSRLQQRRPPISAASGLPDSADAAGAEPGLDDVISTESSQKRSGKPRRPGRYRPDPAPRDADEPARRADQPALRPEPGSWADLRQRLERLPYGHPSSPYHVDGERKPPPPRLMHLELAPPRLVGLERPHLDRAVTATRTLTWPRLTCRLRASSPTDDQQASGSLEGAPTRAWRGERTTVSRS